MKYPYEEFLRKTKFQKKLNEEYTQCLICERKCKIKRGREGYCTTRRNIKGVIYTTVYGNIIAQSSSTLYHFKSFYNFHPGTNTYTIGTNGCNLACFWCKNHDLSHPLSNKENSKNFVKYLSPQELIFKTKSNNCQGISIAFNEPTLLFEFSIDVFDLAKKENLYSTYNSNGYMTKQVLNDLIKHGLDAVNIDIKGDSEMVKKYCGANIEKIWRNAKILIENNVHVEITTVLIDKFNTDMKIIGNIASCVKKLLGASTPFHLARGFPYFRSEIFGFKKPTSMDVLLDAYQIAKSKGLDFVYLVDNSNGINTICPNCSNTVIKRTRFMTLEINLDNNGNCSFCNHRIAIV